MRLTYSCNVGLKYESPYYYDVEVIIVVEISFDLSNFTEDQVTAFEMLVKRLGGTVYGETDITQATVSVTDNDAEILSRLFVGEYILMHSHGVGTATGEQSEDHDPYALPDPIEKQSIFSNFFSGRKAAKQDLPTVKRGDVVVEKSTGVLLLVQEVHSEGIRMINSYDGSCVYDTKGYDERFRPLAMGDALRRPEVDESYAVTDIDPMGLVTLHAAVMNMQVAPPDLVMCYRTAADTDRSNAAAIDDYLSASGMTRDELYEKVRAYAPTLEQLTLGRDGVLDKYFFIWKDSVGDE